jgi:hypothetical protein
MNRFIAAPLLVAVLALAGCSHMRGDTGWITLLDGKTLENWNVVGDANWRIEDGAAVADRGNGFLVSKQTFGDFELRAEFFVDENANSGVFIRCADPRKPASATGYEVNVFDKRPDPSYGTGAVVGVAKASPALKAGGKWNVYEITAKGTQLTLVLNGVKTVDVHDSKLASGPFALQWGRGTIKFRKVQIRAI